MVPVGLAPQKVTILSLKPPGATASKSRDVPVHSGAATLWGHLPRPISINRPYELSKESTSRSVERVSVGFVVSFPTTGADTVERRQ